MRNRLPIYIKNGVSEMKTIDVAFGNLVESFILINYSSQEKRDLWQQICSYIQNLLGDTDISTFESVQFIKEN